jgi:hypothetical protein
MQTMPSIPRSPVYLFYGNQAEPILRARDEVLKTVLLPETRDENLTEYIATGQSATVRLGELLDEIAGDLATVSFIPDAPKCVVVTNPAELFGPGGGRPARASANKKSARTAAQPRKDPAERIAGWIERELPQTGHCLLLLAFEDEADGREVNEKSELFTRILKVGYAQRFSDTKAFFRIEDGLLNRDTAACLGALRDLWKAGKGDSAVYSATVRCLRYLMQANIARERRIVRDAQAQAALFPADRQRNLFQAHPGVQRKYLGEPIYRTGELLKAYDGVLQVYRALRPRPRDIYVPDARGLLEQTLVKLIASPRPRPTGPGRQR